MPSFVRDLIANFEQPWERALVILGVAVVLAVIVRVVIIGILQRLVSRTASSFDDKAVATFGAPLVTTFVVAGIGYAAKELAVSEEWYRAISGLMMTLLVFVWGRALLRAGSMICLGLSDNRDRFQWLNPKTLPLMEFLLKLIVASTMVYMIMKAWHIDVTTWIASAGVAGIAVGFAARDTLANLISGAFILADQPYKVGDYIVLGSGARGEVIEIGMRTTRLLTRDDVEVNLPNAVIAGGEIINETRGRFPKMRVRVKVGVAYGSDVDQVVEVLLKTTEGVQHVATNPEPRVRFRQFGESSLDFELLAWVDLPVYRGLVLHELNLRVYKALAAAGIEIPFPQRDLHIKELPESFGRGWRAGDPQTGAAESDSS